MVDGHWLCNKIFSRYLHYYIIIYIFNVWLLFTADIDECLEVTGKKCPQLCTNTEGGYTCSCVTGFQLMDDQKSCTGNGN